MQASSLSIYINIVDISSCQNAMITNRYLLFSTYTDIAFNVLCMHAGVIIHGIIND